MGFTYRNIGNLGIMKRSQSNENFQTEKTIETNAERNIDSTDIENKDDVNNSQVRKNIGNISKKQLMCEYC